MKQIISIALSLLLLLSSSGLTYAQHFCGDYEIMSKITLGKTHLSCGMKMISSNCGDEHSDDHNCCDNEFTSVDTDDNFSVTNFKINLNPEFAVALISVFLSQEFDSLRSPIDFYKEYSPPPLGDDLLVLYETFLV